MHTFSKMVFSVVIPRVEGTHYTAASNAPPPLLLHASYTRYIRIGDQGFKNKLFGANQSSHTVSKKTYTENEGRFTVIHLVIFYKYCFLFN